MSLVAEVAQNVRKGTLFFLGEEFTLQFDRTFMGTHRQEYEMYVDLVKRVKQRKFDDRRNCWNLPIAEDAMKCLSELVNYGITATTDARKQLGIELKKIAEQEALHQSKTEAQVDLVIPGPNSALNAAMKNYQKGGVKFMAAIERSYNGDEMGLGKSLQLLATIEITNAYPAVILCPVKLKQNWLAECAKWLPHRSASLMVNHMAEITILSYSEIHNHVNYKLASPKARDRKLAAIEGGKRRFFFPDLRKVQAVACDEGHWIKTGDSRRTMSATAIAEVCNPRIRCVMSGTPIENGRPSEMIAPLTFLGKMDEMGGWFHYVKRYCGATRNNFGMDISGATNLKEWHERLSKACYIRRTKAEVLKELPPKIPTVYEAELSNWAEYRRIDRDVSAYLMNQKGRLLTGDESGAAALMRLGLLRKACGIGKVPWIIDWVDTFLEGGDKFILYATHQDVQHALVAGLGRWNPAIVLGGCKDVQREQDKFQNDPSCRLFIGSTLAAGFGITLTAASHIGLAELMWTDSKHQQVIDRAHRIGQKDCVNAYYFLAKGTIDDDMWAVVSRKAEINSEAVDGESLAEAAVLANIVRKCRNPNQN